MFVAQETGPALVAPPGAAPRPHAPPFPAPSTLPPPALAPSTGLPALAACSKVVRKVRHAAASFWLNYFFWNARHLPWVTRTTKWFYLWFAFRYSLKIRDATLTNARRLLPPDSTEAQRLQFARTVMGNFYDFVYDVGRSLGKTRQQLAERVQSIEGHDRYLAARAARKGAIVVTAHMGSFEVGAAALLEREPKLHIVFRRDTLQRFEQLRGELRRGLGVTEAALDDGWVVWLRLRDALTNNEVVALQGDRVMPGQRGQPVPFLGGHVVLPTGPIKLAQASGAPLIPIFSVRTPEGKIRLFIEDAITVGPDERLIGGVHPALLRLGAVIEKYVRAYPEQWLVFDRAWCEDADP